MRDGRSGRVFDLARRSAERARESAEGAAQTRAGNDVRHEDASALSSAIDEHYGRIFPGQFEQVLHGSTLTVTKKAAGSSLKIEVLGDGRFKLSGGSGPGGFNADLAVSKSEAGVEEMEDTLEDWFNIATA